MGDKYFKRYLERVKKTLAESGKTSLEKAGYYSVKKDEKCPNCGGKLTNFIKCDLCGWIVEWYKKEIERKERHQKSRYIPTHIVGEVWRIFNGKCAKCGSENDLHVDHIIPFSLGGSNDIKNLQLLCKKCNLKKSNKI